jgi:hypothetical protein
MSIELYVPAAVATDPVKTEGRVVLALTTGLVALMTARTWSHRALIAVVTVGVYLALVQ